MYRIRERNIKPLEKSFLVVLIFGPGENPESSGVITSELIG